MAVDVAVFGADLRQVDELVAHVDEGVGLALAAQLEVEDAAIEGERLLDVADLDGDVVHADHPGLLHCGFSCTSLAA